ncbi:zinc knuckle domain-containing protein [Arthroderma uncinatum]|uniref:zinc knuckle domain-containing protein n=1 Tax=Arthroderma uncinatum TaxID=74035 RepID=UPI00144A7055|nr:zinc knuckle domain-containing protein [Arthroderma uncinatum]KAF3492198.1 zinc knuckle domain-containing protein [Arthroderma uncinatum]
MQQTPPGPRNAGPPRGGFNAGFRGGPAGYPRAATCYKCGGPNHFARDCQAQAMKCYACGKLGHISRDCTAPNGGPLSSVGKVCYKCSQAGHISRDCPTNNADTKAQPASAETAAAVNPPTETPTEAPPVATGAGPAATVV